MSDWVGRARALAPTVEQFRDEGEQRRRLPRPVFDALREAGFFRLWVPHALGGAEVDVETMLCVVEELSRQDGSAGWSVMIAGNHALLWGYLDPPVAERLMAGNPNAVIAGTIFAGTGSARPQPGGYRVSGRWAFASDCHHADCMVASSVVVDDGEARHGPDGSPQLHAFLLPVVACEIVETWETTGLRGTGSHDFQAQDVFVPEGHYWRPSDVARQPGPLYSALVYNFWAPNIAAVALGIARAALDSFAGLASEKRTNRNPTVLAQRETIQERVGEAEALVRAGRAFVFEAVRDSWATLTSGGALSERQSALNRLAAATAVKNAVEAVDVVYAAAGGTSIYARSPLERCFRDVHVVPHHAVVGPGMFALAGRSFLGLGLGR
jgi:alkylation response protein AidB-like acyl-CoA dehydrogenase